MTIINGFPVSQFVLHAEQPRCSMGMSAEQRSKFEAHQRLLVKNYRVGRKTPNN